MHGILNIRKPPGYTSHDILSKVRRVSGIKKSGHAGTLDPFASGVLLILLGEARKTSRLFTSLKKEYRALIYLGGVSDTLDSTGVIQNVFSSSPPSENNIRDKVKSFEGEYDHIVPEFSAKKAGGKKFYEIKRSGGRPPERIQKSVIFSIDTEEVSYPLLKVRVSCSSGTYIRALARDIGEELSTGAYLKDLERISVGNWKIENSVLYDSDNYLEGFTPLSEALKAFPHIVISNKAFIQLKHGIRFSKDDIISSFGDTSGGVFPVYSESGEAGCLSEKNGEDYLIRRVFNQ